MPDKPLDPPLGAAGVRLWSGVVDALVLDPAEERLLIELCRTADILDALQAVLDRDGVLADSSQGVRAHPALVEIRQQRIVFARLVAALGLPEGLKDADCEPTRRVRGVYRIVAG